MSALSIWEKESFFAPQDVIIAGSGLSGLWSAYFLKKANPSLTITILERGIIPSGASTRNAGFSCFGSPTELLGDIKNMGETAALKLVKQRYEGLRFIQQTFTAEEIDYHEDGGYECFTDKKTWQECIGELTSLNNLIKQVTGLDETYKLADEKIDAFGMYAIDHLIEIKKEGALHSGKLVKCLLNKIQQAGVQVITAVEAISYTETNNDVIIQTAQNITLKCKQLLICTNAFANQLLPGIDIIPNRVQVLVTNPIKGLALKGTFHYEMGYYYFRNLGERLLIGGARNVAFEEEQTTMNDTTDVIQQALETFVNTHLLPNTPYSISDRWSGIMGMGKQKEPIVKALSKRTFCCIRMSGMGVALTPVVAKDIAGIMLQS